MAIPEAKILHISDLHFGWGFDKASWENLCSIAEDLKPDFIVVTGDLVNSPCFWEFSRAKMNLTDLQRRVKSKNPSCEILLVPGNHDTRLFGLIPIRWLPKIALILTVLALLAILDSRMDAGWQLISGIGLGVLAIVVFAIRSMSRDFFKYFQEFLRELHPGRPVSYNCGRFAIVFYPFDSATEGISAARGKIPKQQFVNARNEPLPRLKQQNPADADKSPNKLPQYRIALLHHHPLPIPYDEDQEELLVLHNAGAFLNEVSLLKIRLILHGHKHHRHFSRTTIAAGQYDEFEVGVLSTGTPTAGTKPPRFGYNFNLLELDNDWNMRVIPYEALGGSFKELDSFVIENPDLASKRRYEDLLNRGLECNTGISIVEINQDGDAYRREEYHGFKVLRKGYTLDAVPDPISVTVQPGYIELFNAAPLGESCPPGLHLNVDNSKRQLRFQEGQIKFGRNLSENDPPISFFFHYHAINSYAMSAQQYREMYRDDTNPPLERTAINLRGTPFREIVIIVKFPPGFKLLAKPDLFIESADETRQAYLEHRFRENLFYEPRLNLVFIHIIYPRINLKYGIEWRLTDEPPPSGNIAASLAGKVEEIARQLLRLPVPTPEDHPVRAVLKKIEERARIDFRLDDIDEDPIDVSIMVYDKKDRALKLIAANFSEADARWNLKLHYGDGIAGRAYKMNKSRLFVKSYAVLNRTPCYYFPIDLQPFSDPSQLQEEVVLSVPLRHPDEPTAVYGVLTISSGRPSSKLVDLKKEDIESESKYREFLDHIMRACFDAFS